MAANYAYSRSIFNHGLVYATELDQVSGGCYHRLLQYYRRRGDWSSILFCATRKSTQETSEQQAPPRSAPPPFNSPDADAVIITSDKVSFYVNNDFISSVAPALAARIPASGDREQHSALALAPVGDGVDSKRVKPHESHIPSVQVCEHSKHFSLLLMLCHPACSPDIFAEDLSTIAHLAASAAKYGIEKAVWFLRLALPRYIARDPFRAYVVASTWAWSGEAREAADALLRETIDSIEGRYVEEMETMPARPYYRLLAYHAKCSAAIAGASSAVNTWVASDIQKTARCSSCSRYDSDISEYKPLRNIVSRAKDLLAARPSPDTVSAGLGLMELTRGVNNSTSCSSCRQSMYNCLISVTESIAGKVRNMNAQVGH